MFSVDYQLVEHKHLYGLYLTRQWQTVDYIGFYEGIPISTQPGV